MVDEARLTGYRGHVQEGARRSLDKLGNVQTERWMSVLPQEMSHEFVALKRQHDKVCEELVRVKEMFKLKSKECQAYLSKIHE